MSQDMNPIEHVWDFIGRQINQRNPKCQNIDELRIAILQVWEQFPQERLIPSCAKHDEESYRISQ